MDLVQFAVFLGWLIVYYSILLVPVVVAALPIYHWCAGLCRVAQSHGEIISNYEGNSLGRGFMVFRYGLRSLRTSWYIVFAMGFISIIAGVVVFSEDGSTRVAYMNLHNGALVFSIVISTILAVLAGSLVLLKATSGPKALTLGSAGWAFFLFTVVWLLTPTEVFDAAHTYRWIAPDGNPRLHQQVIYPLFFPLYAIVAFFFGLWRVGLRFR